MRRDLRLSMLVLLFALLLTVPTAVLAQGPVEPTPAPLENEGNNPAPSDTAPAAPDLAAPPVSTTAPDATINMAALALPAREIRPIVPNGKAEGRFGIIGTPPAGLVENSTTPVSVRLLASKAPALNEAINVTLQVHAFWDAPGTVAEIVLPDGAVLLSGNTQARFDLSAGQTQNLNAAIVLKNPGEQAIIGRANTAISPDMVWGDQDAIYLTLNAGMPTIFGAVSGDRNTLSAGKASDVELSNVDEAALQGLVFDGETLNIEGMEIVKEADLEGAALAEDNANAGPDDMSQKADSAGIVEDKSQPVAAANVTVSICWILGSDRDGTTPPLRDAHIQLWDQDSGSGNDLLASGYTGYTNGCRSFTVNNVDTDECCTIDVYFRVLLNRAGRYQVTTYGNAIYNVSTTVQANVAANHSFGTWWMGGGSGNDRSVRIFNDLYLNRRFISEQAIVRGMGGEPGLVRVRWQTGGTDGTYYSLADQRVHLADADAASRDTVVHEASHRYMHAIYTAFPPFDCPSPHFINGASGKHCAWTEGYTYVFVAAADGNPVYTWPSGASLNLETPACNTASWDDGPTVEGRVGGLLIDLADPFLTSFGTPTGFSNEANVAGCGGADLTSGFFDGIWDLLYDQDDTLIVTQGGVTNSFSNAWEARQYPRYAPHLAGHHNTIDAFTHD